MPNYVIGDVIRDTRLRRGYTQEQLSFGICTPASLSRIENGSQAPGKHILDALLERLGVEENIFDVFVNKEEMEIIETIRKITRSIAGYDYVRLQEQVTRLEELLDGRNNLQTQYLIFAKGVLKKGQNGTSEEVMDLFMQAIHITLPEFDGVTPLNANLLTFHEITIINNIAVMHAKDGRMQQALTLGFWLKDYMERSLVDGNEKTLKYPMILFNLSNWLGKMEQFEAAERLADLGIDFCILHGNLTVLPLLTFNKACGLAALGQKEEAKRFFRQSTAIFDATKQEERSREAAELCKKRYQIDLY